MPEILVSLAVATRKHDEERKKMTEELNSTKVQMIRLQHDVNMIIDQTSTEANKQIKKARK